MILFPYPRIPLVIALLLVVPTYGASLLVFYFLVKRPYDSAAVNSILAAAKRCMETRKVQKRFKVNRSAVQRMLDKFSDPVLGKGHDCIVPFIHWGVLKHPMLNNGEAFTIRVDRQKGEAHVEACPGVAWWMLTDRLWLGRRGTAPGLPTGLSIKADVDYEDRMFDDPDNAAFVMLIWELARGSEGLELSSLTYGKISDFASRHELSAEWFPGYAGMRFWVCINNRDYSVNVDNLDPDKGDAGGVRVSAKASKSQAGVAPKGQTTS